jgi:hypothetical protein
MGDVKPGKPHLLGRFQQPGQRLGAEPELRQVDLLVLIADVLRVAFVFMQSRRARLLDARADQTDQEGGGSAGAHLPPPPKGRYGAPSRSAGFGPMFVSSCPGLPVC